MSKKKKNAEAAEETVETVEAAEEAKTEETEQTEAEKTDKKEEKNEKDEKIKALEGELAEQKESFLRLAAEYDNYRKRTANEKLSLYDDATGKAVKELLPVADSVRMALENLKDADPEILKGVELISNQLDKSFTKLKIEAYGAIGEDFDPNLHNAIGMVDNEELGSGKIAAVFQTGYKIGDKIIRHAMVQVTN